MSNVEQNLTPLFAQALRAAKPKSRVDDLGYAPFDDCLVEGVAVAKVRAAFPTADSRPGGRQPRLFAANSSLMLAVNVFAPWLGDLDALEILKQRDFQDLRFDLRLPAVEGEAAQWLPVLLVGPNGVIGIESECTEFLSGHKVEFPDALEAFWASRPEDGWRRQMRALKAGDEGYGHLDAARLIKQYMGLRLLLEAAAGDTGRQLPGMLLYLFWEPLNAARFDEFSRHRAEIDRFARAVRGADIEFKAMSFLDLWAAWSRGKAPKWLPLHMTRLHQLYSFRI